MTKRLPARSERREDAVNFRGERLLPSGDFSKGLFLGFICGLIFWPVVIGTLMFAIPVEPPFADSIHLDSPAPHVQ
jgi:hypothetical protein